MKRISSIFTVIVLVFWGFIIVPEASANSYGYGNSNLSEWQINKYCKNQGYGRGVVAIGNDAYSLRCEDWDRNQYDINMAGVCQWVTGSADAVDRLTDMGSLFGWGCITNKVYVGQPDLNAWCQEKGLTLVSVNTSYAAYKWRCGADELYSQGIDVWAVCRHQYGSSAIDRTSNVYDENAWECWR